MWWPVSDAQLIFGARDILGVDLKDRMLLDTGIAP